MAQSQPEGYLATPPSGNGVPVLVLHAWWGLNDTMKGICDRLAETGFLAFAPDLYHGKIAKTIPEAEELGGALDANYQEASTEVATAARFLHGKAGEPAEGLAVLGFSMGAFYAMVLATEEPEQVRKVVLFYGGGGLDHSTSKASYLGHFAEHDAYESAENVKELEEDLKEAGRPVTFYTYPGTGHWFFDPDRVDAYNEAAAKLAWERTLDFFKDSFS